MKPRLIMIGGNVGSMAAASLKSCAAPFISPSRYFSTPFCARARALSVSQPADPSVSAARANWKKIRDLLMMGGRYQPGPTLGKRFVQCCVLFCRQSRIKTPITALERPLLSVAYGS